MGLQLQHLGRSPLLIEKQLTREQLIAAATALADRQKLLIAREYREAVRAVLNLVDWGELTEFLTRGELPPGFFQVIALEQFGELAQPLAAAIGDAVLAGAKIAAEGQPTIRNREGVEVQFVFNATNPRLANYSQKQSARLIREVSEDFKKTARAIVTESTLAGDNPRTTARKIRQGLGLTTKQAQAVENYRKALKDLDRNALERELRDRRSDRTVARAINSRKPLTNKQIDSLVERYRKRYLNYRAEVIGRAESTRAIQGAQWELFQSYIDEGRVEEKQVRRFWHYTHDARTREDHRQIPGMNKAGVGQGESFKTPQGPLLFPGDPSGAASNTIQCRCTVFPRVVSAELIDRQV